MHRPCVLFCLFGASLLAVSTGCDPDDSGGGGTGSPDRIGRGTDEPSGTTTRVELRQGTDGYAGAADYSTGGSAGLLEIEFASGTIQDRAYIRFDLSSLSIPAGATVVAAELVLTVYRENGGGGTSDILEARRLADDWTGSGEHPYVDAPSAPDGSATIPAFPDGSEVDPNILTPPRELIVPLAPSLIETWHASDTDNDGIALVPSLDGNGMQLHVFACDAADESQRPLLAIEYLADAGMPPTASVTADVSSGDAPLTVTFTGNGSDPDGPIVAYRYDFDDGQVGYSSSAAHTFQRPGRYFVNFTVADSDGRTDTAIIEIVIGGPAPSTYPSITPHPAGGEPPASAESCAPGMARPLPSSRRDILVWPDQVAFDPSGDAAQAVFLARRTVGTQKIKKTLIDAVRQDAPTWRVLQYHLAYGLTRSGDWTEVNSYGPERDAFDTWMTSHGFGTAELSSLIISSPLSTYASSDDSPDWDVEYATPGVFDGALRYAADFYYCDLAYDPGGGSLWRRYIVDETIRRMEMNGQGSECDGTFFDTSSLPGPNLGTFCGPEAYHWYTDSDICAIDTQAEYAQWWTARARQYYSAVRSAYGYGAYGRYLVLPNSNQMLTWWSEPEYLLATDGAFVESFGCYGETQTLAERGAGEWEMSAGRILQYITGAGKMLLAAPDCDVSSISTRRFAIAQFLLLKNDTSYYELNAKNLGVSPNGEGGNPQWYPEYEIDLGCHLDPAPLTIEALRVAGTGSGGLYVRWYSGGLVLLNSSLTTTFEFELDRTYYPVTFGGGGHVQTDGTPAPQTIATGTAVPATIAVPANSVALLRVSDLP